MLSYSKIPFVNETHHGTVCTLSNYVKDRQLCTIKIAHAHNLTVPVLLLTTTQWWNDDDDIAYFTMRWKTREL